MNSVHKREYYCVYDNPDTMSREWYNNSRLLFKYYYTLLMSKHYKKYLGVFPWKTNQLIDSYKALPDKYLRLYMEY